MCPDNLKNLPEDVCALIADISEEGHFVIDEDIRCFTGTFSFRAAFYLLSSAAVKGLPFKTFEAILERSPPVEELFSDDNPSAVMFRDNIGLIERLARLDRADVLALLLEGGASPNRTGNQVYGFTPLEETLSNGSLESLEILLRHPGLDTAWTTQLLWQWASAECAEPRRKQCLRAMAPRFNGCEAPPDRPLPIPEPMTAHTIACVENWPLLARFCRERGRLSQEDGDNAFYIAACSPRYLEEEEHSIAHAAALAALLESCPDLLRKEDNCNALLLCFLRSGEEARKHLRPWMERMGPNGTIDRWSNVLNYYHLTAKTLGYILGVCPIGGTGRKGELSPVARTVLSCGDLSLVLPLLRQSDGLLATEDPDALLEYVLEGGCLGAKEARNGFMAEKRKAMSSAPAARTPEQTRRLAEKLLIMQSLCY